MQKQTFTFLDVFFFSKLAPFLYLLQSLALIPKDSTGITSWSLKEMRQQETHLKLSSYWWSFKIFACCCSFLLSSEDGGSEPDFTSDLAPSRASVFIRVFSSNFCLCIFLTLQACGPQYGYMCGQQQYISGVCANVSSSFQVLNSVAPAVQGRNTVQVHQTCWLTGPHGIKA